MFPRTFVPPTPTKNLKKVIQNHEKNSITIVYVLFFLLRLLHLLYTLFLKINTWHYFNKKGTKYFFLQIHEFFQWRKCPPQTGTDFRPREMGHMQTFADSTWVRMHPHMINGTLYAPANWVVPRKPLLDLTTCFIRHLSVNSSLGLSCSFWHFFFVCIINMLLTSNHVSCSIIRDSNIDDLFFIYNFKMKMK